MEEVLMPARQRGQVYKRGLTWAARYYDEDGKAALSRWFRHEE